MFEKKKIQIGPSIFAGDFGRLADEARRIEHSGADYIHVDIMDGNFVPNLSLSPKALAAINKATPLFLDVHIMVYNPFDYIENLVQCGADCITFHFEATEEVEETIDFIRKCGVQAGLAFCPETSFSMIPKYLHLCDKILIMTVNPGFGGQKFIPETLEKVKFTRDLCDRFNIRKGGVSFEKDAAHSDPKRALPPFDIQVDGGVDDKTAPLCVEAGANVLVAGTYLFQDDNMAQKISELHHLGTL
jgi:ribulose-phosphate 3-epimerase